MQLISFLLLSVFLAGTPRIPVPLDSVQVSRLGLEAGDGSSWSAIPPDSNHPEAVILRDGTESARIDSSLWKQGGRARSSRWVRLPSPSLESLRSWTRPPEGLGLEWTFRRSRSSHSSPLDRNVIGGSFDQPWSDWLSVGALAGVERTYSNIRIDSISTDRDRTWWPWVGGRLCVRSVCWETRTSQHPIPQSLWTQDRMDSLASSHANGSMTRRWDAPPPSDQINWEHAWSARIGIARWRTTIDGDRWQGASHEIVLDPLGSGILRWGLLAGFDDGHAWTGIVTGVSPRSFSLPRGSSLESSPATMVFRYSELNRFSLELRTALRILPPWSLP